MWTGLWVAYVQGPIALSRGCAVVCVCMCLGSVRQTELAELMNSIAFMDEQSRTNRAPLLKASSFPPQVHSATNTTELSESNMACVSVVLISGQSPAASKGLQNSSLSGFVSLGYCIWEVFDYSLIWDQFTFFPFILFPTFPIIHPFLYHDKSIIHSEDGSEAGVIKRVMYTNQ